MRDFVLNMQKKLSYYLIAFKVHYRFTFCKSSALRTIDTELKGIATLNRFTIGDSTIILIEDFPRARFTFAFIPAAFLNPFSIGVENAASVI